MGVFTSDCLNCDIYKENVWFNRAKGKRVTLKNTAHAERALLYDRTKIAGSPPAEQSFTGIVENHEMTFHFNDDLRDSG